MERKIHITFNSVFLYSLCVCVCVFAQWAQPAEQTHKHKYTNAQTSGYVNGYGHTKFVYLCLCICVFLNTPNSFTCTPQILSPLVAFLSLVSPRLVTSSSLALPGLSCHQPLSLHTLMNAMSCIMVLITIHHFLLLLKPYGTVIPS